MRKSIALRVRKTFALPSVAKIKPKLLTWGSLFNEVIWLDSNEYKQQHTSFEAVLAVQAKNTLSTNFNNAFAKLSEFRKETNDWIFGYLSYDLKNDIEQLSSENYDGLLFPDLVFFQPKKIIKATASTLEFLYLKEVAQDIEKDYKAIIASENKAVSDKVNTTKIQLRVHKEAYYDKVKKLLDHIYRGDIYEANFCIEFFAQEAAINPLQTYFNLNKISKPPFAAYVKLNHLFAMCASPERYLRKTGNTVISQPIKGTAKRANNLEEDKILANTLAQDPKERAENIMIVDLVRNDLSKHATKGSVTVTELCKVYTFKQVHQLISTISANVTETTDPVELLKDTFPMGSMTGAPKISAMKIIEALEETKRGLYSGAIGYFTPEGDFDFNVVIRSILYNKLNKYVSFSVGSAITAKSNPEKEYEECLIKAKAMRAVLENK